MGLGPILRRGLIALLLAWSLLQGLRESWRALMYDVVDPWPAEAPVIWTPSTRHVAQLRADLGRLPLEGSTTLAVVTDASLGDQAWYQYLWLAYLLPEHDLIWTPHHEPAPLADARLVLSGNRPRLARP